MAEVPVHLRESLALFEELQTLGKGEARDLTDQQIPVLRRLFEDSTVGLYFFAREIFGYKDLTTSLHLPICQLLGRWGSSVLADGSVRWDSPTGSWEDDIVDSYRRIMVCIPRECFKTSLCTRANAVWTVLRSPDYNATIGIFNEKQENTETWCASICPSFVTPVFRVIIAGWRGLPAINSCT